MEAVRCVVCKIKSQEEVVCRRAFELGRCRVSPFAHTGRVSGQCQEASRRDAVRQRGKPDRFAMLDSDGHAESEDLDWKASRCVLKRERAG